MRQKTFFYTASYSNAVDISNENGCEVIPKRALMYITLLCMGTQWKGHFPGMEL